MAIDCTTEKSSYGLTSFSLNQKFVLIVFIAAAYSALHGEASYYVATQFVKQHFLMFSFQ